MRRPRCSTRSSDLYARADVATPMITTPGAGPYNLAGMTLVASGKGIYLGYGVPLRDAVVRPAAWPCVR